MLNKDLSFTIICQKGIQTRRPTEVYFNRPECISQMVVVAIDPVDTSNYGYPLFAAYGDVDFEFKTSKEAEDYIWRINNTQLDYTDRIRATSVGSFGDYFLAYKDDFKWQRDIVSSINFPSRYVYSNGELSADFHWICLAFLVIESGIYRKFARFTKAHERESMEG